MNEHFKNIIVSATATIPYAGGISVLIDKYVPSELEQRKENFRKQIEKDIEAIKDEIKPGRLESKEYMTILFKVFKNVMEEHNEVKIKSFRAILKNSARHKYLEDPEIEFYIKLVNELTISHIKLLHLIRNESYINMVHYIHPAKSDGKELQTMCIYELERLGLIKENNKNQYCSTDFCKRFIEFIELEEI